MACARRVHARRARCLLERHCPANLPVPSVGAAHGAAKAERAVKERPESAAAGLYLGPRASDPSPGKRVAAHR
jgi:hypothetical protein